MDGFLADLRYGLRMLLRTPLLSIVAVATIGLGVGAVTFAFSIIYGVYRDLPVRGGDRVMVVSEARPDRGDSGMPVPYLDLLDLRESQTSFEALEGYYGGTLNLAGDDGPPERYQGGFVTAGTLARLGVPPVAGRVFAEGDDRPGSPALLVLGYDAWMNRFGGDPAAIGRQVRINGEAGEVIGVMPEGFKFPFQQEAWTNLRVDPATLDRRGRPLMVVGHLREGVSRERALEELTAIAGSIEEAHPVANEGVVFEFESFSEANRPPQILMMLSLLMAMVVGVLLVACANVANVLLARAVVREREVAVRSALGAGRWRVVRQLLTEAGVLGVVGGLAGVAIAWGALVLFERAPEVQGRPFWMVFELDAPVLLFTSAVALLAAVAAGTWPAVRASGTALGSMLRDESRGSSSLRLSRLSSALVVAELALSCGLMIAGGLTLGALFELNSVDYGFEADAVMTARLGLFETEYPDRDARARFHRDLLDRLGSEPGVTGVALASSLPGLGGGRIMVEVDGETYASEADLPRPAATWVSEGYFDVIGLHASEGRTLLAAEAQRGGDPAVVVSRTFAERRLGGGPAIGRSLRVAGDSEAPWLRVVGVVPDVASATGAFGEGGGDRLQEAVYLSLGAEAPPFSSILARTDGPPSGVAGAIRIAVADVDRNLPLYWVRTLREALDETNGFHRIFGGLFGVVAAGALFLAAVGLYGVIDFSVASRVREMGLRMAMGAGGSDVLRLVLGRVAFQLGLGLVLGILVGLALGVPLAATLYGVELWNPVVYGVIVAMVLFTGAAAAFMPAIRAVRVDPAVALRL